jgi:hypothetical protein
VKAAGRGAWRAGSLNGPSAAMIVRLVSPNKNQALTWENSPFPLKKLLK